MSGIPRRSAPRRAFTLLEVVVVLVLLGITAALAAPAFLVRRDRATNPLREAIASARRTAIRRAEAVTLEVRTDGRWIVTSDAFPDSLPLLAAALPEALPDPLRLRISALGACLPDEYDPRRPAARAWDPLVCGEPALRGGGGRP